MLFTMRRETGNYAKQLSVNRFHGAVNFFRDSAHYLLVGMERNIDCRTVHTYRMSGEPRRAHPSGNVVHPFGSSGHRGMIAVDAGADSMATVEETVLTYPLANNINDAAVAESTTR